MIFNHFYPIIANKVVSSHQVCSLLPDHCKQWRTNSSFLFTITWSLKIILYQFFNCFSILADQCKQCSTISWTDIDVIRLIRKCFTNLSNLLTIAWLQQNLKVAVPICEFRSLSLNLRKKFWISSWFFPFQAILANMLSYFVSFVHFHLIIPNKASEICPLSPNLCEKRCDRFCHNHPTTAKTFVPIPDLF